MDPIRIMHGAKHASAWTALSSSRAINARRKLRAFAARRTSSVMASVTIITTTLGVLGMAGIAVVPLARSFGCYQSFRFCATFGV